MSTTFIGSLLQVGVLASKVFLVVRFSLLTSNKTPTPTIAPITSKITTIRSHGNVGADAAKMSTASADAVVNDTWSLLGLKLPFFTKASFPLALSVLSIIR